MSTLVIVPCGKAKIWDRQPQLGPVEAREAYTGSLFRPNRAYAERFADRWVILSAKYGFIDPDWPIPGPYEVSFKRQSSHPIDEGTLAAQVDRLGLWRYETIIGLGGKEYREAARRAFGKHAGRLRFPFEGLSGNGLMASAAIRAVEAGDPLPPVGSERDLLPTSDDPGDEEDAPPAVVAAREVNMRGGKYLPLTRYLEGVRGSECPITFPEIEKVLGFPLPASARKHSAWWANEKEGSHSHAASWLGAGWRTSGVNLGAERLVFLRERTSKRT